MDTILYVGDSYDIKQMLMESDKKIDAVQNGMIALNALSDSENKYSAVIIEDQLPLMDPSNLIKQLEHYSKTPIIAIVRSDKRRTEILTDFENGLSGWFEPKRSSIEHFNELLDSCGTFIGFSRALNKNHRLQINSHGLGTILGVSDSMQKIYTLLLQIQEKDVITILYGESGTGKNLTAKLIKMNTIQPFHVAFPVKDLKSAEEFYTTILGCSIGRRSDHWIDFKLFGHQVVAHLNPEEARAVKTSDVDHKKVPVRHFGVVLPWDEWHVLSKKLKKLKVEFIIDPYIRFKGEVGEQATMFFLDPSGNALEIKTMKVPESLWEINS